MEGVGIEAAAVGGEAVVSAESVEVALFGVEQGEGGPTGTLGGGEQGISWRATVMGKLIDES